MATAEDLLKKHEQRKRKNFQPVIRRVWDVIPPIEKAEKSSSNVPQKIENVNRNNLETDIGTIRNEIDNTTRNKLSTNNNTNIGTENRYRIRSSEETKNDEVVEKKIVKMLRKSTGIQRNIMQEITAHLKSTTEDTNIVDIPIETLALRIKSTKDITRTSIKRLQQKSILQKGKGERGRLGTTKIIVPNFILKECINLFACHARSLDEIDNENRNNIGNDDSVYSSSNYINNTTTNTNRAGDLPEEWRNIYFQPLEHIGFSQTQLKQLHTINTNTPQVIQESIYQFAFGLENNPKVQSYNDPLNVFMGLLRKGGSWFEKEYISPKVKAEREMLAAMEKELAELKEIEEKKFETAFSIWHLKLSNSDKENILLNYPKIEEGSKFSEMAKMGNLKKYFKEEVYSKS